MVSSVSESSTASYKDLRVSGLVSGMDTEETVDKLLSFEKNKVASFEASKQKIEWEQEAYRDIMDNLQGFEDDFFEVLDSDNNILSTSGVKSVDIYNVDGDSTRYLEMSAGSEAIEGAFIINEITQLAIGASISSGADCKGSIEASTDLSGLTYPTDYTDKTFNVNLDGLTREIDMSGSYADEAALVEGMNQKLEAAFGAGRVEVSLTVDNTLSLSAGNSILSVTSGAEGADFLSEVGMTSGAKNIVNLDGSSEVVFGESENLSFRINGELFTFDKSVSIRNVMSEINSSEADVNMTYSSMTDRFTLTSKETGASSKLEIENLTGHFFGADSYLNIEDGSVQNGQDAVFYLNDPDKLDPIYRSSNFTTIDGVNMQLKQTTTEAIDYNVGSDTAGVYDKIEGFVKKFNELFESISEKVSEKVDLDYAPLSDEQRGEMSESEIENWEEQAKSGTLRNDSILQDLVKDFRNAFWDKVDGTGLSFYDIGIKNSDDYNTFELEIDETKLKQAIADDAVQVLELFNKEEITYSATMSSADRADRYESSGFAQRLHDILEDNMRTNRNRFGHKGLLVEKAGLDGDYTDTNNLLNEKISAVEKKIKEAIDKMNDKEDYYFKQFTAMETAIQRMNAQSEWLYSQFTE
jgi:flagellar hook-associated protein 2